MIFTSRRILAATTLAIAAAAASAVPAAAHTPTVTVYCQYQVVSGGLPIEVMSDHFTPQGGSYIRGWLSDGQLVYAGKDGTATGSNLTWRQIASFSTQPAWSAAQYLLRTSAPCFS